ncbi:MAG TPA: hypothetical protein VLQ45_14305 [Thermoanaerobaculia bacterium]|nr:hypothetical protein [Thermoanaerobaculia bacterium]
MPEDDPDDLHATFLEYVAAYEGQEPRSLFVVLSEAGVALPSPDELDDSQVRAKLWDLINALALLGTFLHHTGHLSDRELYAELWGEILREPMVLMPDNPAFACHIDMIGTGSEEHSLLYLKYYADEDARRSWQEDWPEDSLPEPEEPPNDRDHLLPKAEYRKDRPVM